MRERQAASAAACATWLADAQKELETARKHPDPKSELVDDSVERVGKVLSHSGRQLAGNAGGWYANVSGSTCHGTAKPTLTAVSFEGRDQDRRATGGGRRAPARARAARGDVARASVTGEPDEVAGRIEHPALLRAVWRRAIRDQHA